MSGDAQPFRLHILQRELFCWHCIQLVLHINVDNLKLWCCFKKKDKRYEILSSPEGMMLWKFAEESPSGETAAAWPLDFCRPPLHFGTACCMSLSTKVSCKHLTFIQKSIHIPQPFLHFIIIQPQSSAYFIGMLCDRLTHDRELTWSWRKRIQGVYFILYNKGK